MKAKEKAEELIGRFSSLVGGFSPHIDSKDCALICVEEIIKTLDNIEIYGTDYDSNRYELISFYNQVKEELLKL